MILQKKKNYNQAIETWVNVIVEIFPLIEPYFG